ncbi:hypothetical protein BH11ACT1_BH11ACT1_24970 [soil metagenome]
MIAMWSDAPVMARVAFVLAMFFGVVATVWVVAELVADPGGVAGISIGAAIVVAELVLSLVAVRLPRVAPTVMGVAVALLLVLAVVEAVVDLVPRDTGPVVAIGALVVGVPSAFLGLRSARLGGWLLVGAGLAPVVEIVGRILQGGVGGGLHLGGSSGAAAMPLILLGLLFLVAAATGRRGSRETDLGPLTLHEGRSGSTSART